MSVEDVIVYDNEAEHRLEIRSEGLLAIADYNITGDVIAFPHTLVPKEFSGRGYGTKLAAACMEKAEKQGLKVLPECSFILAYMKKHPETQKLAHFSVSF